MNLNINKFSTLKALFPYTVVMIIVGNDNHVLCPYTKSWMFDVLISCHLDLSSLF